MGAEKRNCGGLEMSELKACPFCGKDAHIELGGTLADGGDGYFVMCDDCGFLMDGLPKAEAIAAWNLRTPDWQELARELACIAAEQRLPYTCDSCGHKTDKPCPTDALGLCEAQRWYPTEVIVAMAVKAGLLEG